MSGKAAKDRSSTSPGNFNFASTVHHRCLCERMCKLKWHLLPAIDTDTGADD